VTGAIVYSLRLETARREGEARIAARHRPLERWARGMGAWGYAAAGLVLTCLALAPFALLG